MKHMKKLKVAAVSVVAICALVLIGFGVSAFGRSQYVVESGSMEPAIRTGSVVFDSQRASYEVGDVITFRPLGSKETVTHRIVQETTEDGSRAYLVKGDANNAPDPDPVPADTVLGKVALSVPYVGYAVNAVRSLPGLIICIIIPATIIIYQEFMSMSREVVALRNRRKPAVQVEDKVAAKEAHSEVEPVASKPRRVPRRSSDIVVALMIAAMGLTYTQATKATYSSDVVLTGVTIQAGAYASD